MKRFLYLWGVIYLRSVLVGRRSLGQLVLYRSGKQPAENRLRLFPTTNPSHRPLRQPGELSIICKPTETGVFPHQLQTGQSTGTGPGPRNMAIINARRAEFLLS